ncbi:MAG TPA: type II toxin-antitoxin system Phd/YefM family antitoxin [Patescibacteria group bacterium]
MLQTNFTTIQQVRRNYKKVVKQVEDTNTPTVVISNNQPQFAIVSMDMIKKIQMPSGGTEGLLALAEWAKKENIKGPKDLSTNHDKYIWGK